jgi:hypothetical protein
MDRLSRVAFCAGWAGIAILVVFVFLLVFRWIDVPSLAVILPFAIGYGALEANRHKPDAKDLVVLTTGAGSRGGIAGSVGRLYRRLLTRGEAKAILPQAPARIAGAELHPAEWVARQIRQLKGGRMEVKAPETARVGREETVIVAIARSEHDEIIAAVAEGRQVQASVIKVNTFMRVELRGDAFDITPPDNVNKVLPDDQPVTWEFKIVPKQRGPQTLSVHAIVRFRLPGGGEEFYELAPQIRRIVVSIGPVEAVKQLAAKPYVKFAVGAWTAIAATFGAVYSIDPLKERINALLKPYADWLFGLFG